MNHLEPLLGQLAILLEERHQPWALVGGVEDGLFETAIQPSVALLAACLADDVIDVVEAYRRYERLDVFVFGQRPNACGGFVEWLTRSQDIEQDICIKQQSHCRVP